MEKSCYEVENRLSAINIYDFGTVAMYALMKLTLYLYLCQTQCCRRSA